MLKVANINISDDSCGPYVVNLRGVDAQYFKIIDNKLYFLLDQPTKYSYTVIVSVEDFLNRYSPVQKSFTLYAATNCGFTTTTTTTTFNPTNTTTTTTSTTTTTTTTTPGPTTYDGCFNKQAWINWPNIVSTTSPINILESDFGLISGGTTIQSTGGATVVGGWIKNYSKIIGYDINNNPIYGQYRYWMKLKYNPISNEYSISFINQTAMPGKDSIANYRYTDYGSNNKKFKVNDIITINTPISNPPLQPYNGKFKIKEIRSNFGSILNNQYYINMILECVNLL